MSIIKTALLTVTCLVWSGPAAADLILPQPITCPTGSYADTDHCGTTCQQRVCKTHKDCTARDTQCSEISLCIKKGMRRPCGRGGASGQEYPFSRVTAACPSGKKCPDGSTCVTAKRCVPSEKPPPPRAEPPAPKRPAIKKPATRAKPSLPGPYPVQPKPSKPSGCAMSSPGPGVGSMVLLLLVMGLKRRRG